MSASPPHQTMIAVEDLFKHSVVISCMPSRIQLMKKSFAVANVPFPAAVVDAVRCGNTVEEKTNACRLSHGKAVEYALKAKWPYVLVLEDDAWPRFNVRQKLEECLKTLPDNNIKIAALGYTKLRTADTCKWRKARVLTGAQSYVVFSPAFSSVIDAMNKSKHPADLVIGEFAEELLGFSTYAADTICFTQYNSPDEDMHKKRIDSSCGYYICRAWRKDTKLKPWFWTAEHVEEEYAKMNKKTIANFC